MHHGRTRKIWRICRSQERITSSQRRHHGGNVIYLTRSLLIAGWLAAMTIGAQAQIVAIGASNVAGRGVSPSDAWPAQLEGMLAASPGTADRYCNACFTENYPIPFTRAEELQLGLFDRP